MKKISNKLRVLALATVMATSAATPVAAETHYVPHIAVGGHAGVSLSKMSFSPSIPQTWHTGTTMGVSLSYTEEKLVGILAELNFEQRGWKESFDNAELQFSRTLNYIELPIMTHIAFGGPRMKCIINLGPEFGFMIAESTSSNFDLSDPYQDGVPATRRTEQMTAPIHSRFDYGITAGVGGEYYLTPKQSVYLEARFYYGLGNIFPSSKADTFSASRGMSLAVTMGYNFRLK